MSKIKRYISLLSGLFILSSPAISYSEGTVIAVKSSDIAPYNLALKGVEDLFRKRGIKSAIKVYDLEGAETKWDDLLKKIREGRPDLILTFGTTATKLAKRDIKDTPVIFSTVLNPVESGIVDSLVSPGGNVTGASLDVPVERQFSNILDVVPGARRIGVLYNPRETGIVIEEAMGAAKKMGLTLIAEPVSSETDLPAATGRLLERIDVLWSVADSTVFSRPSIQQIILETIKYKIPFMGLSPAFVKAGALFSLKWDDADIGRQAGESALKVILDHENVHYVPGTTPRNLSVVINLQTAKVIGAQVPERVMKRAELIR